MGSYVTFGRYEQDNNTENGQEPIEWLVLDYDAVSNRALLLSRYGLDAQPYNSVVAGTTWNICWLRGWLNGTFLNKAFTAQEQAGILITNVNNDRSQGYSRWSTSGGNNTADKVFLLSYAEANKYLGVMYSNSGNNTKSRVAPTAYAIKQGASTSSSNKADGKAAGWWWLRSPGCYQKDAAIVYNDGSLRFYSVKSGYGCIRPALWINLESGIF